MGTIDRIGTQDVSALGYFEQYCRVMSENNNVAHVGIYAVAVGGLAYALKRVRPFSKFKRPSDVPNSFINNQCRLTGYVQRIEPNGGILMVEHMPLIPLLKSDATLPVKIAGVQVSGHGLSWLQTIVAGNKVHFIPMVKNYDNIECEILLPHIDNKKVEHINLGEKLVAIGFGSLEASPVIHDKNYLAYINRLQHAQELATRKKLGSKYYLLLFRDYFKWFIRQTMTTASQLWNKQRKPAIKDVPVSVS